MKQPIQFVLSETYETWDEEAIELGETDDKGFSFEDEVYDLEDLQNYLDSEGFIHASESPVTNRRVYLSTESEADISSGDRTVKSLHCSKVLDGDGKELTSAQQAKLWTGVVRQAVGEKLENNQSFGVGS